MVVQLQLQEEYAHCMYHSVTHRLLYSIKGLFTVDGSFILCLFYVNTNTFLLVVVV